MDHIEFGIYDNCIQYESDDSDDEYDEQYTTNLTKRAKIKKCLYYTYYMATASFLISLFYWSYIIILQEDKMNQPK